MKPTEFWLWRIRDERNGKFYKTRHRMTEADALARHPEAVRVEGSLEVRDLPETEEELRAFHQRPAANAPAAFQK